ncbi:Crp/Fnr family transcriptional regulator [Phenylobacterium sp.]|uniref:Crp/Fnr family transcriptional regulator n=1 Tax=Phenylobacterium sp. TaxID=1871053 RepID=UPI0035B4C076
MSIRRPPPHVERTRVVRLLTTKLSAIRPFSAAEHQGLAGLPFTLEAFRRENAIGLAGGSMGDLMMMVHGCAARSKVTRWGGHPIIGFLLPGDLFDWPLFSLRAFSPGARDAVLDHNITSISRSVVAVFRAGALLDLFDDFPSLRQTFEAAALIDQNIAREWLANLGARPAAERLAHALCEHFHRMKAAGLAEGSTCHVPFSQARLSASQGLSIVHTNRVLKRLQEDGLLQLDGRVLRILDQRRLEGFADFSPTYLNWRL